MCHLRGGATVVEVGLWSGFECTGVDRGGENVGTYFGILAFVIG